MPRIMPFMPPRPSLPIIFSICWYCFISLLTSAGVSPAPLAMRARRVLHLEDGVLHPTAQSEGSV